MKHPDFKLYFAVMSHGRPENVLGAIQYLGTEATWFVGEGEAKAYRKAGAKNVVAGGSLPVSRNLALDAAWRKDLTCVQISDDLRRFSLATARLSPITALSASLLVKASLDARNGVYWRAYRHQVASTFETADIRQHINLRRLLYRETMWFVFR